MSIHTRSVVRVDDVAADGVLVASTEYADPVAGVLALVDAMDRRDLVAVRDAIDARLSPRKPRRTA